eukprot:TRINITY_DN1570_c0_g1_i10.p1 TRINITY_DN1570_c0_g1~~TRINITY_DN1570_c0_g1_i10.p1  ORF type:complete len:644 (-),score=184.74 TRINITY_DN1570_c0_g1_i10:41-1972(-)
MWQPQQEPPQVFDHQYTQQGTNFQQRAPDTDQRPPRPIVSFGFGGQLVLLFPPTERSVSGSGAGQVRFKSLGQLLEGTETLQSLNKFPGPLTCNNNVNSLEEYSSMTIQALKDSQSQGERDKAILWRMLQLMNSESSRMMQPNPDGTMSEALKQVVSVLQAESAQHQAQSSVHHSTQSQLDVDHIEKLLIQGNRKEAMQQAEAAGHWGVVMLIARTMGEAYWGETVSRFASQFDPTSPLSTFMHVSSGCGASSQLNNAPRWPETLAMLLANPAQAGHQQRIAALGHQLMQSSTAAAHTCFLMAELAPQPHDCQGGAPVVLLGGDHWSQPTGFCTPHAIQCTEMLEAALQGSNSQFRMPALQPYKLVYAHMLAELGLTQKARAYLSDVKSQSGKCSASGWRYHNKFLSELEWLAKRLDTGSTEESTGVFSRISSFFGGSKNDQVMEVTSKKHTTPQQQQRPQAQQAFNAPREHTPAPSPAPAAAPAPAPAPAAATTPSKGAKRGFFTGMVAALTGAKQEPKEGESTSGQLEDDTDMYYNKELGRWVERGKENESAEAAAPPPPTVGQAQAQQAQQQPIEGQSLTAAPSTPAPAAPASAADRRSRLANLRYVNTYGNEAAPAPAAPAEDSKPKPKIMMMNFAPPS